MAGPEAADRWYDLIVTFGVRRLGPPLVGHIETGEASVSDPVPGVA